MYDSVLKREEGFKSCTHYDIITLIFYWGDHIFIMTKERMRAKFIINPSAGKQIVQKNVMGIVGKLVDMNLVTSFDFFITRGKDDAMNEASKLHKGEYDFVVAVGGDGTVNEVVNGIIRSESDTPLAIIAAGTVNDFARAAKLPKDVKRFCEMIKSFKIQDCDVGTANDRYFLNVLAGGMMTDVAYKVSSDTKTVLGKLGYYLEGAKDLPASVVKSIPLRYEHDGRVFEEDTFLFLVSNSNSVGGFPKIAPMADISDGKLDVCIIKKLEIFNILPMLMKIPLGEHINDKGIVYFQTQKLVISCLDNNIDVPLDFVGEKDGKLPICIENKHQAIKLLVPENV